MTIKNFLLKALMLFSKWCIGFIPSSTKSRLRNNLWLHNLYSKNLQRAGLFYGFPSQSKLQKLYEKTMEVQTKNILQRSKARNSVKKVDVLLVLCEKQTTNRLTLNYLLENKHINRILVEGESCESLLSALKDFSIKADITITKFDKTLIHSNTNLFVMLSGSRLHPEAIPLMSETAYGTANIDTICYCDTDFIDHNDKRSNPELYPDWNPDLQLSTGYVNAGIMLSGSSIISHFANFSTTKSYSHSISYWLANLYLQDKIPKVLHLAIVLLHQIEKRNSDWAKQALAFSGFPLTTLKTDYSGVAKLSWDTSSNPLVSLIIPTKNCKQLVKDCIDSIITKTTYKNYEILLIDNNSDEQEALEYFQSLESNHRIRVLKYSEKFNYSAINNFAVKHAKGDIIGLINNDIEVITPGWLTVMVGHVLRPDIGCVGAKLLYSNNRIQHAGVVLGYGGGAGHAHKHFPRYHPGYLNRLCATNNFSAVTAACLLVEKNNYLEVGGLDETNLTVAFNDVDFCLNILSLGKRNIYCAEAELYHHESVSRGLDDTEEKRERFSSELAYLQNRWQDYIQSDPAYNPNLTLRRENFSIREIL